MTRGLFLFAAAGLLVLQTAAHAQLRECAPDVEKFCKGIPPGGGRLMVCLRSHGDQLSPGCRSALGGGKAAAGGGSSAQQACRSDAMKFCASARGDQAKMKSCLASHAAELSDGCKTAMIQAGASK
jgi:hypothetical protein